MLNWLGQPVTIAPAHHSSPAIPLYPHYAHQHSDDHHHYTHQHSMDLPEKRFINIMGATTNFTHNHTFIDASGNVQSFVHTHPHNGPHYHDNHVTDPALNLATQVSGFYQLNMGLVGIGALAVVAIIGSRNFFTNLMGQNLVSRYDNVQRKDKFGNVQRKDKFGPSNSYGTGPLRSDYSPEGSFNKDSWYNDWYDQWYRDNPTKNSHMQKSFRKKRLLPIHSAVNSEKSENSLNLAENSLNLAEKGKNYLDLAENSLNLAEKGKNYLDMTENSLNLAGNSLKLGQMAEWHCKFWMTCRLAAVKEVSPQTLLHITAMKLGNPAKETDQNKLPRKPPKPSDFELAIRVGGIGGPKACRPLQGTCPFTRSYIDKLSQTIKNI